MKKRFIGTLLVLSLIVGGFAIAADLPIVGQGRNQTKVQVFAPTAVISVDNGALDVSSYSVIMFNADVTIQFGGTGSTYSWPADTPLGIGEGVTSITISDLSTATTALVM